LNLSAPEKLVCPAEREILLKRGDIQSEAALSN
jgi:hypothetical protein